MLTFKIITKTGIKSPSKGDVILTKHGWQEISEVRSETYDALDYGMIRGSADHIVTGSTGSVRLSELRSKLLRYTTKATFPVLDYCYASFLGVRVPIRKTYDIDYIDFDMACTSLERYSTKMRNYRTSILHFSGDDDYEFIISSLIAGYSLRPFHNFKKQGMSGAGKVSTSPYVSSKVTLLGTVRDIGYEIDIKDYFMYYKGRMFIA